MFMKNLPVSGFEPWTPLLEATALPAEQQPLPIKAFLFDELFKMSCQRLQNIKSCLLEGDEQPYQPNLEYCNITYLRERLYLCYMCSLHASCSLHSE